ncbi:MAG: class I SAM-dependent methyltransferase [candidate division Zixibacteria bacterium]|nr:class I SAM-dependent methyltransferase [candidate division Zixibacteria bacterium]
MKPYDKFAYVYDRMGADLHSVKMAEYTFRIIRKFDIRVASLLDLCCGTGTALKIFHEHGYNVAGLDGSTAMLSAARKKIQGKRIPLFRQNLPCFNIPDKNKSRKARRFDLVTSFFDSLNYLKNKTELKAAFHSVNRHLEPGGWFIFDMNTPEALKTLWGSQCYAGAENDLAWIFQNDYNPDQPSAACRVTLFVKKGKGWQRHNECHIEYGFENKDIKNLLRESGFTVKGLYNCFTFNSPAPKTTRICAVARKK